jgi:IS1 family transposase
MNKLSIQERARIIHALVEGNSINATCRMFGCGKPTILRLLKSFGEACQKFHDEKVTGLTSRRIQMDELWAFVHCKQKNIRPELRGTRGIGDTWTWLAIDADSKLMVSWFIGPRHAGSANAIMHDVALRLTHKIQLTTDGLNAYWDAAINAFNCDVDFAQLVKIYGEDRSMNGKYSPPDVIGIKIKERMGDPDPAHISTSFVERANLSVRMGVRRYTRLTNAHSKKIENHIHHTAIFFTVYNWCRIHTTLRMTPAMAAGLTTRVLEIEDLLAVLDTQK